MHRYPTVSTGGEFASTYGVMLSFNSSTKTHATSFVETRPFAVWKVIYESALWLYFFNNATSDFDTRSNPHPVSMSNSATLEHLTYDKSLRLGRAGKAPRPRADRLSRQNFALAFVRASARTPRAHAHAGTATIHACARHARLRTRSQARARTSAHTHTRCRARSTAPRTQSRTNTNARTHRHTVTQTEQHSPTQRLNTSHPEYNNGELKIPAQTRGSQASLVSPPCRP